MNMFRNSRRVYIYDTLRSFSNPIDPTEISAGARLPRVVSPRSIFYAIWLFYVLSLAYVAEH